MSDGQGFYLISFEKYVLPGGDSNSKAENTIYEN